MSQHTCFRNAFILFCTICTKLTRISGDVCPERMDRWQALQTGVLMCERLCARRPTCKARVYVRDALSCRLMREVAKRDLHVEAEETLKVKYERFDPSCSNITCGGRPSVQYIVTRQGLCTCIDQELKAEKTTAGRKVLTEFLAHITVSTKFNIMYGVGSVIQSEWRLLLMRLPPSRETREQVLGNRPGKTLRVLGMTAARCYRHSSLHCLFVLTCVVKPCTVKTFYVFEDVDYSKTQPETPRKFKLPLHGTDVKAIAIDANHELTTMQSSGGRTTFRIYTHTEKGFKDSGIKVKSEEHFRYMGIIRDTKTMFLSSVTDVSCTVRPTFKNGTRSFIRKKKGSLLSLNHSFKFTYSSENLIVVSECSPYLIESHHIKSNLLQSCG